MNAIYKWCPPFIVKFCINAFHCCCWVPPPVFSDKMKYNIYCHLNCSMKIYNVVPVDWTLEYLQVAMEPQFQFEGKHKTQNLIIVLIHYLIQVYLNKWLCKIFVYMKTGDDWPGKIKRSLNEGFFVSLTHKSKFDIWRTWIFLSVYIDSRHVLTSITYNNIICNVFRCQTFGQCILPKGDILDIFILLGFLSSSI